MWFDPKLREELGHFRLLAQLLVQIIVAIITTSRFFDPPADLRPVRKREGYFRNGFCRIEIDQVGQLLSSERTGGGEREDKEDAIDDVALPRSIWAGYDCETLKKGNFCFFQK